VPAAKSSRPHRRAPGRAATPASHRFLRPDQRLVPLGRLYLIANQSVCGCSGAGTATELATRHNSSAAKPSRARVQLYIMGMRRSFRRPLPACSRRSCERVAPWLDGPPRSAADPESGKDHSPSYRCARRANTDLRLTWFRVRDERDLKLRRQPPAAVLEDVGRGLAHPAPVSQS
jgi:hypothetical protein